MRLEGSLDAFGLPDVFALLAMTKKTGALHLRRDGAEGVLHFAAGSLTGGSSDVTRQVLVRRLVAAGAVGDEDLAAAVEDVRTDPALTLVAALLRRGAVDDDALHAAVSEQVVDAVFDLMRWPGGEFGFQVDEPNGEEVGVALAPEDVVAEVAIRLERWAAAATSVPSPSTVLSLALAPGTEPSLTRDEWALVALVDGRRTVADVVALAGAGEFSVVSRLAALVDRGLLRAGEDEEYAALVRRQSVVAGLEAPPAAAAAPPPATPAAPAAPSPPSAATAPTPGRAAPQPTVPAPAPTAPPVRSYVGAGHGAVDGSAAVLPELAAEAEADSGVNRSLVLRLIAGVRGL